MSVPTGNEYIGALISSGIFVRKLVAKVWRFVPSPQARMKLKKPGSSEFDPG
jgi:hypothetical protein